MHRASFSSTSLIGVENIAALPVQLAVRELQPNPQAPSGSNTSCGERCVAAHRDHVLWPIGCGIQVWRVDETGHGDDVDNRQRHCFLLRRLAEGTADPAENHGINRVDTGCEEEAGHVARGDVERRGADDEANHGDTHHDCDVPGTVIVLSRRDADEDTNHAGDESGRCSQDESDGGVEAERLDDCWEELELC